MFRTEWNKAHVVEDPDVSTAPALPLAKDPGQVTLCCDALAASSIKMEIKNMCLSRKHCGVKRLHNSWPIVGTPQSILLGVSLHSFTDAPETQTIGGMSFGRTMENVRHAPAFPLQFNHQEKLVRPYLQMLDLF